MPARALATIAEEYAQWPDAVLATRWDKVLTQAPPDISTTVPVGRYERDPVYGWSHGNHPLQTAAEKASMQAMLISKSAAFASSVRELTGYTGQMGPHVIELTHDRPIIDHPRKRSAIQIEIQDEKCGELRDAGIIERAGSVISYCSAPVMPCKRNADGEYVDRRFTCDLRGVNEATKPDRHPMPTPDEIFDQIGQAPFLSRLDLVSSFFQVPLAAESMDKTNFWWGKEIWRFKRMPQGGKNSSAHFMKMITFELTKAGLLHCAAGYIDDIVVWSATAAQHELDLAAVLDMLISCGLKASQKKTLVCAETLEFIGMNVGPYGLSPSEAKVAAVKALPPPRNLKELQALLGYLGYYRGFVRNFSARAKPMNKLLTKDAVWEWGSEQQAALNSIRNEMCEMGRALRRLDKSLPILVYTDYSSYGIGALLAQVCPEGEYMVATASRSLNIHESRYASYKGEMLGMVYSVKIFSGYLHGVHFTIVTDHRPLLWLMRTKHLVGQYARWALMLQEYDFDVIHRAGVLHTNADVLSRYPQVTTEDETGARADEAGEGVAPLPTVSFPDGDEPEPGQEWLPPDVSPSRLMAWSGARVLQAMWDEHGELEDDEAALPEQYQQLRMLQDTVGVSWWGRMQEQGVVLYEPFGGLCAGLEMLLTAGVKVVRYLYSDISKAAQRVATVRVQRLAERFPHLLTSAAIEGMWALEPNVKNITSQSLQHRVQEHWGTPWIVIAGFECQDMSTAGTGQGLGGRRSGTYHALYSILESLYGFMPLGHLVYMIENVAAQHNWRHTSVRVVDFPRVCTDLGWPLCVDAAGQGSYAHRLRNFWTNAVDVYQAQLRLDAVHRDDSRRAQHILLPGATARVSKYTDRAPFYPCNVRGQHMRAFPTLVCAPGSYAFRDEEDREGMGMVWDSGLNRHRELLPVEREVALGYEADSTKAPDVTEAQRHKITGGCMDQYCLAGIWKAFQHTAARAATSPFEANAEERHRHSTLTVLTSQLACPEADPVLAQSELEEVAELQDGKSDPWADEDLLRTVLGQPLGEDASWSLRKRVNRRAARYKWDSKRELVRIMKDGTTRIVPRPGARHQVVLQTHEACGHFGIRRTAYQVALSYLWPNMRASVECVLQGCMACARVKACFSAASATLQPLPIESMFYRWHVDLAGPFDATPRGHTMIIVMIDAYSKYAVLLPLRNKRAETCADAFLQGVLGHYGSCAEVVTDQGPEWLGEFQEMLESCLIDHRRCSPDNPQANGQCERMVQTVKRAVRTIAEAKQNLQGWDRDLPYVQLGYNSAKQASSLFSPMLLMHGREPTLFPATVERLEQPLQVADTNPDIAKALWERVDLIKQSGLLVGENLKVGQHRDSARFQAHRDGSYVRKPRKFRPGDYIFTEAPQASRRNMDTYTHPEVCRVISVSNSGVLTVKSESGPIKSIAPKHAAPCHVPARRFEVDYRTIVPGPKACCTGCGDTEEEHMLLCDTCPAKWHLSCLQEPLSAVPQGEWQCDMCMFRGVALPQHAPGPRAFKPQSFAARRAESKLDAEESKLHGRFWKGPFNSGKRTRVFWGVIAYRGPAEDFILKENFIIYFEDTDSATYTRAAVEAGMLPEGTKWPKLKGGKARHLPVTPRAGAEAANAPAPEAPD